MAECAAGVCQPQRTQGLQAPAPKGAYKLVSLNGPGVFVGGHVSKQGGDTDLTFVSLDIDGQNVVNSSYAAMRNLGFTQQNPYGLVPNVCQGRQRGLRFSDPAANHRGRPRPD